MIITVRPLRTNEGRLFLEIHGRAIRGLAAAHYPREVLDAWTLPSTEESVRQLVGNPDGEIRLIAELDGEPVGLGALVTANAELRACYVVPEASRRGIGTALVAEIERIAAESGLERLELIASLNAEAFYASLGYETHGRTGHMLRTGHVMAAVKMSKMLRR